MEKISPKDVADLAGVARALIVLRTGFCILGQDIQILEAPSLYYKEKLKVFFNAKTRKSRLDFL